MDKSIVAKYRFKKILKIFSILLLVLFIFLFAFDLMRIIPQNVHFTNASSSSVTVSWDTRFPTRGSVVVTDAKDNMPASLLAIGYDIFHDTRDVRSAEIAATQGTENNLAQNNSFSVTMSDFVTERKITDKGVYYTHHVEITGLDPETDYKVMVGDGVLFLSTKDLNGNALLKTTAVPEAIQTPVPAYGQIRDAQNKEAGFDELPIVTDGIVYFNYYDETTKETSNVFSSVLNSNGNWYVDLSSAVDKDGEPFLEKYMQEVTNIYGQLLVDAGPLGVWKKTINLSESTPAETVVLNIPGAVQDPTNPDSLIRIGSSLLIDKAVKGVNAAGSCVQIGWCTCGEYSNNKWNDCDCDKGTMESRKCNGQGNAQQEAQNVGGSDCANGKEGDLVWFGNQCKQCGVSTKGYWGTVDSSKCGDNKSGAVFKPTTETVPEETTSYVSCASYGDLGKSCKSGDKVGKCATSSGTNFYCNTGSATTGDGDKDDMDMDGATSARLCTDVDGCNCIYNKGKANEQVISISKGASCQPKQTTPSVCTTCHDTTIVPNYTYNLPGCAVCHEPQATNEDNNTNEIFELAMSLISVYPGETCHKNASGQTCLCFPGNGTNKEIGDGEKCDAVQTPTFLPVPEPTLVPTTPFVPTATPTPGSLLPSLLKLVSKAFAAEDTPALTYEEFAIDPTNSTISILAPGEYILEKDGEMYFLGVTLEDINSSKGQLKVYVDTNKNGVYDEGQDAKISDFGSVVKVSTLSQTYMYHLSTGYNFVSFPFLPVAVEQRTAASMLVSLNETFDDSIYSISKYDGRWHVVGQNEELYDSQDFQLIPGQGYIIKVKSAVDISILGRPVQYETADDVAPITLYPGWNLVGTYGTKVKKYTAKTLIEGINKYETVDFTADNVSRWESDVQRYDGFQLENENGVAIEYGYDFPINSLQGYFVRILQGKGNWQQELGE